MVSLGNFRSVSQVIPWKQLHYCWDHFRGPKRIPPQALSQKNEQKGGSNADVHPLFKFASHFAGVIPSRARDLK